jgi:hypothetical protein
LTQIEEISSLQPLELRYFHLAQAGLGRRRA